MFLLLWIRVGKGSWMGVTVRLGNCMSKLGIFLGVLLRKFWMVGLNLILKCGAKNVKILSRSLNSLKYKKCSLEAKMLRILCRSNWMWRILNLIDGELIMMLKLKDSLKDLKLWKDMIFLIHLKISLD